MDQSDNSCARNTYIISCHTTEISQVYALIMLKLMHHIVLNPKNCNTIIYNIMIVVLLHKWFPELSQVCAVSLCGATYTSCHDCKAIH